MSSFKAVDDDDEEERWPLEETFSFSVWISGFKDWEGRAGSLRFGRVRLKKAPNFGWGRRWYPPLEVTWENVGAFPSLRICF